MTMRLWLLIVVPTYLTFPFFIGPLVRVGWVVLLEGGGLFWLVRSRVARHTLLHDDWGGIRWVRYHSVFWSRLSEVNPQWPWGLSWEERGVGERVLWGQGWLGGLLGWFLIAAKRSGLPVQRQMLTQEIRGLGFLFSHELLLHTASFFYFCRTVWHFRTQKKPIFTKLAYAVSWEKICHF